jgi:hypothetical protein
MESLLTGKFNVLLKSKQKRVPDGQFVPLGTIDQRQQLIVNEGLWGQAALPHVAFKKGREVKKQGGDSDLI